MWNYTIYKRHAIAKWTERYPSTWEAHRQYAAEMKTEQLAAAHISGGGLLCVREARNTEGELGHGP